MKPNFEESEKYRHFFHGYTAAEVKELKALGKEDKMVKPYTDNEKYIIKQLQAL